MRSLINFLKFYHDFAGKRLYILFFLMILGVFFQTLGVGLMLPILEGGESNSKIALVVRKWFCLLGLEYSLMNLLIFFVGFNFFRAIVVIGQQSVTAKLLSDMLVELRCEVAEKIFRMKFLAFLKYPTGYFNNLMTREFERVVTSFKYFANLLIRLLSTLMYIVIPFFIDPILVLVVISLSLPLYYFFVKLNRITKRVSVQQTFHSAALQKTLIQSLGYYKYFKSTFRFPNILKKIVAESKVLGSLQFKQGILAAIRKDSVMPFIILALSGIIFFHVEYRGRDIVEILFLIYLLYSASNNVINTQQSYGTLLNNWGSIDVYRNIYRDLENYKEKMAPEENKSKFIFDSPFIFKNVCFGYEEGKTILRNINIVIPPNATIAFVGESGAGKSTIMNLLLGLIKPNEGSILFGNVPMTEINTNEIRKNTGYVTQENVVFNDTFYNNITLWDTDHSDNEFDKVKSASYKAHIGKFIEEQQESYNTLLGEGGINISGGQRQRMNIARELFKDPKMIIFDEATSALDTKTEKEIQKNIEELKGKRTIILIAHRLSTVKNCDEIFVLKDGRIAESGTYSQLIVRKGEFKRMVDLQEQNYDAD